MDDLMPLMECPNCGNVSDDFDGFGVLACDACGFCTHPAITGDVCEICGKVFNAAPNLDTHG